jgi:hypothetical protein
MGSGANDIDESLANLGIANADRREQGEQLLVDFRLGQPGFRMPARRVARAAMVRAGKSFVACPNELAHSI